MIRNNTLLKTQQFFVVILLLILNFSCSKETVTPKTKKSVTIIKNDQKSEQFNLRLLVWEGYAPKSYIAAFENNIYVKYGKKVTLTVKYTRGSDDFFPAIRNRSVDLITLSHHSIKDEKLNYIKKGLIIPPDLKNIPNIKHLIPQLKNAGYQMSDGKLFGIPIANGSYGLAYDTAIYKKAPESWNVFWDPKNRGKYIIGANEYLYNVNITALAMGYPLKSISNFTQLNNPEFRVKLKLLALHAGRYWIGIDKPQRFSRMYLGAAWGHSLPALKKSGKIWKMARPKEGTLWWIDNYMLTNTLKNKPFLKKIAEEWINFTLSPSFQLSYIMRELGLYPVVVNISDQFTQDEIKKVQPERFDTFMDHRILQQTYSERNRNGLKLLWREAMKGTAQKGK